MQLVLLANIWLLDWLYCVFNYYWCFYPSINSYTYKYLLLLTNIDNIYNKTIDLYLNDLMIIFKLLLQATRHDTPRTLLIRIRPCSSCPSYVVIFTSFIFKGNSSSLWEVSLVLHQRAGYQLNITDWTLIKCQGYILVLSQFCGGGWGRGGKGGALHWDKVLSARPFQLHLCSRHSEILLSIWWHLWYGLRGEWIWNE